MADVTLNVGGQTIHAWEEGPSKSKLAILIHGWSSSWFAVSPLLPLLREKYRCLAIDLPGYGQSPRPDKRITIPDYADMVADLIRQQSPNQPAILVGHSMGGMTSLTVARKYPELVERLVLICPTISGNLSYSINLTLAPFVMLERFILTNWLVTVFEPLLGITDSLLRLSLFADRTGIKPEDYARIKEDTRKKGQGRVRAECFTAMQNNDLRGKLGEIKTPSLVIWGMEDNVVPLRDASVVANEWPDTDLRVIPNAGHWPQFERTDLTVKYVRAFLGTPVKLLNFQI